MVKLHERTRARRSALQVLYTSEIQGCAADKVTAGEKLLLAEIVAPGNEEEPEDVFGSLKEVELQDYAEKLVNGVSAHIMSIDARLASTSENWSVNRMPIVDRCILRLAAYEMMFVDEVPVSVSINEAVELAKDFGGEDESHRFVNGVLGRIARQLEEGITVESAMDQLIAAAPAADAEVAAPADEAEAAEVAASADEAEAAAGEE